ncbi:hypothetical protein [Streptomyces sp. NPDC005017]|uniref:hypothetical protein n=1 Tax=Streptomyces sp. NPDC005017 TaxID=3364706 RepID=UPI0036997234
MTGRIAQKPALRVPETGWSKVRHQPGKGMRTCVAAVADESAPPAAHTSADWNIVRGDD